MAATRDGVLAINVEPADCPFLADGAGGGAQAADRGQNPKPAPVAPAKAKKATAGRDTANGPAQPRTGTKQARLIEMLEAPEGASIAEIGEAFGWQPHTVRGTIAGALKKKLGLAVTSEKDAERGLVYRIPA